MNKPISPQRECPDCGYDLEPGLRDSLECRKCGYSGKPISPEQREAEMQRIQRVYDLNQLQWFSRADIGFLLSSEQAWREKYELMEAERDKELKLCKEWQAAYWSLHKKYQSVEERASQAVEVLKWYASFWNHDVQLESTDMTSMQEDRGKRARDFLSSLSQKEEAK